MRAFSKYACVVCHPFEYERMINILESLTKNSFFINDMLSIVVNTQLKTSRVRPQILFRNNSNSLRCCFCVLFFSFFMFSPLLAQRIAVKSNFLHDGFLSPNLGVEVALSHKFTFNLSVDYKPFTVTKDKTLKELMIQPEIRYWLCEPFEGHFFSLQYTYAEFNFSKFPFRGMKDKHIEGYVNAAGLSYGYNRILSPHWSLEGSLGLGAARLILVKGREKVLMDLNNGIPYINI